MKNNLKRVSLCFLSSAILVLLIAIVPSGTMAKPQSRVDEEKIGLSTGYWDFWIRDSRTGFGLTGEIVVRNAEYGTAVGTWSVADAGHHLLELPEGAYTVEVSSENYGLISTRLVSERGKTVPVTIFLDPKQEPVALNPEIVQANTIPGNTMLHGHVVSEATGKPLTGANVSLANAGIQMETNNEGYFLLYVPVHPSGPDSLPETDKLRIYMPGYKEHRITNIPLIEGDTHFMVELQPGEGIVSGDHLHKLMRTEAELQNSQIPPEFENPGERLPTDRLVAGREAADALEGSVDGAGGRLTVWAPPPSIRVGFDCVCATCSSVQVMSLETYTKRGLKNEWIASWRPHSLRSGAIAYRSYGAYHVYHPRHPNYDICSTACCQVNRPGTSASTNSAVDYTAGILLQRNNAIFRAEYSAENNNLTCGASRCSNRSCTCGNGNAGSPGASWPCVSDSVDAGQNCFGHGRGMCQWGTQRWAIQGRQWKWLVNHYYNNDGRPSGMRSAFMTSPLDIEWVWPDPSELYAGDWFFITVAADNFSEIAHNRVMIGASIYSPASGFISDPGSDERVTLQSGYNEVGRWFYVPPSAPSGTYDLVVALWLDIDEDGAITGNDLPLVTYTYPSYIFVY